MSRYYTALEIRDYLKLWATMPFLWVQKLGEWITRHHEWARDAIVEADALSKFPIGCAVVLTCQGCGMGKAHEYKGSPDAHFVVWSVERWQSDYAQFKLSRPANDYEQQYARDHGFGSIGQIEHTYSTMDGMRRVHGMSPGETFIRTFPARKQ